MKNFSEEIQQKSTINPEISDLNFMNFAKWKKEEPSIHEAKR